MEVYGIEVRDDNVTIGDVTKLDFANLDLTSVSEGISTVSVSFPTYPYSGITTADITNWDRHMVGGSSVVGYLTSYTERQTLDDVVGLGNSTSRDVSIGGSIFADKIYYPNVWSTLTDIYDQKHLQSYIMECLHMFMKLDMVILHTRVTGFSY